MHGKPDILGQAMGTTRMVEQDHHHHQGQDPDPDPWTWQATDHDEDDDSTTTTTMRQMMRNDIEGERDNAKSKARKAEQACMAIGDFVWNYRLSRVLPHTRRVGWFIRRSSPGSKLRKTKP